MWILPVIEVLADHLASEDSIARHEHANVRPRYFFLQCDWRQPQMIEVLRRQMAESQRSRLIASLHGLEDYLRMPPREAFDCARVVGENRLGHAGSECRDTGQADRFGLVESKAFPTVDPASRKLDQKCLKQAAGIVLGNEGLIGIGKWRASDAAIIPPVDGFHLGPRQLTPRRKNDSSLAALRIEDQLDLV